ncbi:hypothetical protein K438DRAFT_1752981 [Mycena galopus ATCC 62051]|nr:hypothetical protein K438DRAFT_1752981 [Mycena galopus ATCC 62051]
MLMDVSHISRGITVPDATRRDAELHECGFLRSSARRDGAPSSRASLAPAPDVIRVEHGGLRNKEPQSAKSAASMLDKKSLTSPPVNELLPIHRATPGISVQHQVEAFVPGIRLKSHLRDNALTMPPVTPPSKSPAPALAIANTVELGGLGTEMAEPCAKRCAELERMNSLATIHSSRPEVHAVRAQAPLPLSVKALVAVIEARECSPTQGKHMLIVDLTPSPFGASKFPAPAVVKEAVRLGGLKGSLFAVPAMPVADELDIKLGGLEGSARAAANIRLPWDVLQCKTSALASADTSLGAEASALASAPTLALMHKVTVELGGQDEIAPHTDQHVEALLANALTTPRVIADKASIKREGCRPAAPMVSSSVLSAVECGGLQHGLQSAESSHTQCGLQLTGSALPNNPLVNTSGVLHSCPSSSASSAPALAFSESMVELGGPKGPLITTHEQQGDSKKEELRTSDNSASGLGTVLKPCPLCLALVACTTTSTSTASPSLPSALVCVANTGQMAWRAKTRCTSVQAAVLIIALRLLDIQVDVLLSNRMEYGRQQDIALGAPPAYTALFSLELQLPAPGLVFDGLAVEQSPVEHGGLMLHPVPPRTHPDLIRSLPVYSDLYIRELPYLTDSISDFGITSGLPDIARPLAHHLRLTGLHPAFGITPPAYRPSLPVTLSRLPFPPPSFLANQILKEKANGHEIDVTTTETRTFKDFEASALGSAVVQTDSTPLITTYLRLPPGFLTSRHLDLDDDSTWSITRHHIPKLWIFYQSLSWITSVSLRLTSTSLDLVPGSSKFPYLGFTACIKRRAHPACGDSLPLHGASSAWWPPCGASGSTYTRALDVDTDAAEALSTVLLLLALVVLAVAAFMVEEVALVLKLVWILRE